MDIDECKKFRRATYDILNSLVIKGYLHKKDKNKIPELTLQERVKLMSLETDAHNSLPFIPEHFLAGQFPKEYMSGDNVRTSFINILNPNDIIKEGSSKFQIIGWEKVDSILSDRNSDNSCYCGGIPLCFMIPKLNGVSLIGGRPKSRPKN